MAEAQEERAQYLVTRPYHVFKGQDKAEIARNAIERYLDGERLEDIAIGHNVSDKRLYQLLLEADEEGWKRAQLAAAIERLEKAKAAMDVSADNVDIARARESARLAQWDLERVCRRIYGTDAPPAQGQGTISINISVGPGSQTPPTIDVTPSPAPQQDDTHQD